MLETYIQFETQARGATQSSVIECKRNARRLIQKKKNPPHSMTPPNKSNQSPPDLLILPLPRLIRINRPPLLAEPIQRPPISHTYLPLLGQLPTLEIPSYGSGRAERGRGNRTVTLAVLTEDSRGRETGGHCQGVPQGCHVVGRVAYEEDGVGGLGCEVACVAGFGAGEPLKGEGGEIC